MGWMIPCSTSFSSRPTLDLYFCHPDIRSLEDPTIVPVFFHAFDRSRKRIFNRIVRLRTKGWLDDYTMITEVCARDEWKIGFDDRFDINWWSIMQFRIMIDKQDFLFRFYIKINWKQLHYLLRKIKKKKQNKFLGSCIFIHFSEIYWVKVKSERDTLEARYNIFLEILKLMLN